MSVLEVLVLNLNNRIESEENLEGWACNNCYGNLNNRIERDG